MLFGFSGGMGTGKTLNTIKFIIENDSFAGRKIFYHGIRVLLFDYKVCDSFQGWFYGIHWPANSHNEALKKKVFDIEKQHRLAELEDFPYLQAQYLKHQPMKQWLTWFKKTASKKRLAKLNELLAVLEITEDELTYEHIEPLNLDWHQFEDATQWYKLPPNSVILIDEVQNIWPVRASSAKKTEDIQAVATSRHQGFDLCYISQDFNDVDQFIRRRLQEFRHFEFFGKEEILIYSYNKHFNPTSSTEKSKVDKEKVKRDKNFYGLYLSAIEHTHNVKYSKKYLKALTTLAFSLIGFVGIVIALFYSDMFNGGFTGSATASELEESNTTQVSTNTKITPLTTEREYIQNHLPRTDLMPYSAPIYDQLTSVPTDYPQLFCIDINDSCNCYTQQNTLYSSDTDICRSIAKYGFYDPYQQSNNNGSSKRNSVSGLNKGGIF